MILSPCEPIVVVVCVAYGNLIGASLFGEELTDLIAAACNAITIIIPELPFAQLIDLFQLAKSFGLRRKLGKGKRLFVVYSKIN